MAYTVDKLAKASGVSVRTLHFYDEIGLLKPAYYGENNYRYYEQEQFLMLQQILFYRELGFPLNDIQAIISSADFDKIQALTSHRITLEKRLSHAQKLIETIDNTIAHLRGKTKMKNEDLYYGFDSDIQKKHEQDLVMRGVVTQEFLNECNKKVNDWTDEQKNIFITDVENIYQGIIQVMNSGLPPSSEQVQQLIKKHFHWLERTWTPDKKSYLGLINLYQTTEFKKFFDDRHPLLLNFFLESMRIFAKHNL